MPGGDRTGPNGVTGGRGLGRGFHSSYTAPVYLKDAEVGYIEN